MRHCYVLSAELSVRDRDRIRQIVEFWNDYAAFDDPGSTTREVLEELQQNVTDCLSRDPADINCAEGLTAKAMLLLAG